jgi:hypothetical protein
VPLDEQFIGTDIARTGAVDQRAVVVQWVAPGRWFCPVLHHDMRSGSAERTWVTPRR